MRGECDTAHVSLSEWASEEASDCIIESMSLSILYLWLLFSFMLINFGISSHFCFHSAPRIVVFRIISHSILSKSRTLWCPHLSSPGHGAIWMIRWLLAPTRRAVLRCTSRGCSCTSPIRYISDWFSLMSELIENEEWICSVIKRGKTSYR